MVDRDINVSAVDTLHNVQGLSHISKSVEREDRRKQNKKRKEQQEDNQQQNIDEKLEEELEVEEKEILADDDMDHVDFRA